MIIATNNNINYNKTVSRGIYTRDRQIQYKRNLKTETKSHTITQGALLAIIVFIVFMIFCSCAGMLYFKSVIANVQMDINEMNSQIRQIEQENSILKAEKISAVDIESIKISAERMGMSLPKTNQVEYVIHTDQEKNTSLKSN